MALNLNDKPSSEPISESNMTDERKAQEREYNRNRQRFRRSIMTEEQRVQLKSLDRERRRQRRIRMIDEQISKERERNRIYQKQRRSKMTEEQRSLERERRRLRDKQRRENMNDEQRALERDRRRTRDRQHKASMSMSDEQRSQESGERNTFVFKKRNQTNGAEERHNSNESVIGDASSSHSTEVVDRKKRFAHIKYHITDKLSLRSERRLRAILNASQMNSENNLRTESTPQVSDAIDGYENGVEGNCNSEKAIVSQGEKGDTESSDHMSNRPREATPTHRALHNFAMHFLDSPNFELFQLRNVNTCNHCHARLLPSESQVLCCLYGSVRVPVLSTPQEFLLYLYTIQSNEGAQFKQHSRAYNRAFDSTLIGVHVDENLVSDRGGIYSYHAREASYYKISSPHVYDTDNEIENRLDESNLNAQVLAIVKRILDVCNPFVRVRLQISLGEDLHDVWPIKAYDHYQYKGGICSYAFKVTGTFVSSACIGNSFQNFQLL